MDGARSEASGRSAEVGGQDGVTVQPTEGAGPATPPTYPSNTAVIFAGTVVHSEKVPELSLLEHSLVGVLPDGKIGEWLLSAWIFSPLAPHSRSTLLLSWVAFRSIHKMNFPNAHTPSSTERVTDCAVVLGPRDCAGGPAWAPQPL